MPLALKKSTNTYQLLDALQRGGSIGAGMRLGRTACASDVDPETLCSRHRELLSELARLSVIGACGAAEQEIALPSNTELEPPR
jgi:hypothetical protein